MQWTAPTRRHLDEDNRYFLHQSASTPCLSAVSKVEGICIEDMTGRRYMDFHGNNVHHVGYGQQERTHGLGDDGPWNI